MEDGTPPSPSMVTQASLLTSEVTGDSASADSVELQQTLSQDSLVRESMPTEWTDEKHSLYLKSMEASFVNELYNSFDLLGRHSLSEHLSDSKFSGKKHADARISSGQFKLLQIGCWGKVNFARHGSQLDKADGSGVLENRWIRHFRPACRNQRVTSSTLQEKAASGSPEASLNGKMALTSAALAANLELFPSCHYHLFRYNSVGSNTEVTDQNFVDEDIKGEKGSHTCNAKRMKTSVVSTPSNDQVVPFGKFPVTADVTKNSFSLERGSPCSSSDLKSANEDGFP